MGQTLHLTARDGHVLSAYEAGDPTRPHKLVVVQEIFGVNHHIRSVCDGFAADGFHVLAPALFDRIRPGIELGYTPADVKEGVALRGQIPPEAPIGDIAACVAYFGHAPTGIIGYCWGGTVAWDAATMTDAFRCAVGWYGGGIAAHRTAHPHCPVELHFGGEDHSIPHTDVTLIRDAQPDVEMYVYDGAGHGFGCSERSSFDPEAYRLARERSLAFLKRHLW
ncbi:carboxymethylenebutenolidase [Ameyamaea chiangmaiensis NBRC 103196]|uniref:Dienelactone hydrolase family protein n=1 Tax=Ameyamaea chiangmaiensis TaxID=442969 RepID=A0A850P9S8_9PROT|nr:dienelactone hydrolase family protein [Ameyamaea chiangmaiensis]MBS4074332.1 dienelactone hydrolase family protein [Ameyamaea chiangmaiensis]NVN41317.1 dienelactone hydrolase family protein [Ameyamaea chiangmaiensis]GBQ71674.1 carboxymethylenebutenolidase [Ameyamaea chiangmaiensis NBRC 103196]